MIRNLKSINKIISQYQFIQSQHKFCFSKLNENVKLRFNLHLSEDHVRQYIITQNHALSEIQSLLKESDESFKNIKFCQKNQPLEDLDVRSIDGFIAHNIEIMINNKNYHYDIEFFNSLNHFNDSKYDSYFQKYEIPTKDAEIIKSFVSNFEQVLENTSKQSYSYQEINQNLLKAIDKYSLKFLKRKTNIESIINLMEENQKEISEIDKIQDFSGKQSSKIIRLMLLATILQFFVLLYVCYFKYGWDFTEPIGYLIQIIQETLVIAFFLKTFNGLGQSSIYQIYKNHYLRKALQNGTNFKAKQLFLQRKNLYLSEKIDFKI